MVIQKKHKAVFIVLCIAVILIFVVLAASKDEPFAFMKVSGAEDAQQFLSELGWECDLTNASISETTLPTTFDDTFISYNSIQLQQGCDLTKYAGKTVTIFTVPITNYTQSTDHVLATLIIYRKTVIGGDIHSAAMDGFMHTLV